MHLLSVCVCVCVCMCVYVCVCVCVCVCEEIERESSSYMARMNATDLKNKRHSNDCKDCVVWDQQVVTASHTLIFSRHSLCTVWFTLSSPRPTNT